MVFTKGMKGIRNKTMTASHELEATGGDKSQ